MGYGDRMSLLDHPSRARSQPHADQPAAPLWHAHRLLVAHGLSVARVISVDVDSVLYVARDGRARTAWLTVTHGFVSVCDVPGFERRCRRRLDPHRPPQQMRRRTRRSDAHLERRRDRPASVPGASPLPAAKT